MGFSNEKRQRIRAEAEAMLRIKDGKARRFGEILQDALDEIERLEKQISDARGIRREVAIPNGTEYRDDCSECAASDTLDVLSEQGPNPCQPDAGFYRLTYPLPWRKRYNGGDSWAIYADNGNVIGYWSNDEMVDAILNALPATNQPEQPRHP